MTHFYEQYRSIKPYLMRKDDMEAGKEQLLQTVEDRAKLVQDFPKLIYVDVDVHYRCSL